MSKKNGVGFFLLLLLSVVSLAFQSWDRPAQPPAAGALQAILRHPLDPGAVLVASDRQVYARQPSGNWIPLDFPGTPSRIKNLVAPPDDPQTVYALTEDALVRCDLVQKKWITVYRAKKTEVPLRSFAVLPQDPEHWFLGTSSGFLESDDAGRFWYPFPYFSHQPVSILAFASGRLFLAAGNRLYESKDLDHFKELFYLKAPQSEGGLTEPILDERDLDEETSSPASGLQAFLAFGGSPARFWLGTSEGVFQSEDAGRTWQILSQSGLGSLEVRHLAYFEPGAQLFAGTPAGVFRYRFREKRWEALPAGSRSGPVSGLAVVTADPPRLFALTGEGLVVRPLLPDNLMIPALGAPDRDFHAGFLDLVRREPSAEEMQRAVIRYADVGNGKIKRWHAGSRLAALLPTFSFGKDLTSSTSLSSSSGKFYTGPDDISRGWDASVNWDFGDLIWSSAQTSIDSREKLMVELRQDLLTEANRIYFERRRLQSEILLTPAESEQADYERGIRLEELTALLDGMTGGWFSKQLRGSHTDPDNAFPSQVTSYRTQERIQNP